VIEESPPVNLSEFEIMRKISKSRETIRKYENDLMKHEKLSEENQRLAQRLGLDKTSASQALRASEEAAISSKRTKLAEMKAAHNKFVQEHGYPSEVFAK
jgi:hypothetical protein